MRCKRPTIPEPPSIGCDWIKVLQRNCGDKSSQHGVEQSLSRGNSREKNGNFSAHQAMQRLNSGPPVASLMLNKKSTRTCSLTSRRDDTETDMKASREVI